MTSSLKLDQAFIQAFEKVPDLYLILSPELQILTASDAYLATTHTVREEITGKSISQMLSDSPMAMSADALQRLDCSLRQALHSRRPHQLELQQCHETLYPAGCVKHYRTMLNTPVLDDKGEVLYIIHKMEDVTERVKSELELLRSRQLLQTTIDSSLDMIQVFEAVRDEQGEIIDFRWILNNRTSEEIYGDVVGRSLLGNNPGVAKVGIFDTFKRVVETGIPDQTERHYVYEQFDGWFYQSTVKLGDGVATTTRDITERKKAEQELKATKESLQVSQERLQLVLANTASSIMLLKPVLDAWGDISDFEYIYTNEQLLKSVNRESLLGKRLAEEFPGIKQTELFQHYKQVATESSSWSGETHINFDGFDFWAQVYATRVKGNLLVTYFGITERKKAEEALVQSKELIQTVFDVSLNPIAYHKAVRDASGKIVDFEFQLENRAANRYTVSDRTGKRYSEAYPGIRDTIVFKKYCEVVETGRKLDEEVQINLKGKDFWFHLQGVKMDDGLVATAVDITERKKSEQEILRLKDEVARKATDKYQALFNTMDEGLSVIEMIYDAGGKPVDLRLLEVNPAYEKITGLQNVAGKLGSEIVPSEQYWLDAYDSVVKTGKPLRYENYHAGARQWYRTHTSRIGGPGSHVIANLFEDITERKQRDLQQEFLLKFSDTLRNLSDEKEIEETGLRMLAEFLQLDRAYVFVLYPVEDRAVVRAEYRIDWLDSILGEVRMSDFPETVRQIENETIVFNDIDSDATLSDLNKASLHAVDLQAFICASVRKSERNVIWSLAAATVTPRVWTKEEVELIEIGAERIWVTAERAKAEEALRNSEEKYRTLFDSIDEGYCIIQMLYDEAGKAVDFLYLQVNQAFERNNGLHNAEGKTIRELAPDIEPKWMEIYDHVAQTGNPLRFEESSEALHRIFSLYAFRIGDPTEHKVAVIFTDITEHKKSQEALRQSEEQFRLFVMTSSDIIYKMNADWSRMHKLTGKDFLPDTEEPTDSWTDVYIPADDRILVEATIQQAIQSKKAFELEHRVNKADGTVGWVSSRAIPVLDEQGNIIEWFGTASDITLRKQAEQQLQDLNESLEQQVAERTHELNESKLFAEQIMEATPDFIMIFNLITNKVEFVNQGPYAGNKVRFEETLHIDYDQLMRRAHPEDRQTLQAYIDRFRTTSDQKAHTLEYRVVDKGKTTWYRSRGKLFKQDETGKPTHFISVVQDISDLKQLEQENLQMRLDQQRNNLLVILNAQEEERRRISEALHNGVGQILYSAKLHLGQWLQKSGPSDPVRQVDKILDEAIRQTRGLSHQLTPALLEQFGLQTAFEEMGNSLSTPALQLQCLVYNLPKQLDKHLQLVLFRIAQEMANNIIRHSNATEASLLLRTHGRNLVLIAEDNGRGFDLSSTRKKGIGLSSIKNRVELLNGTFSVNTAPGQGTQVKITLPL